MKLHFKTTRFRVNENIVEQNCDENDWCVRSPLTLRGVLCPTTGRTYIGLDDDATLRLCQATEPK